MIGLGGIQAKLAAAAVVAVAALGGTVAIYHAGYKAGADHMEARDAGIFEKEQAAYVAKIHKAEADYEDEQKINASVRAANRSIDGLQHSVAAWADSIAFPDQDIPARVLSARVGPALEKLQDGAGGLLAQCDQLNIEARRANRE